MPNCIAVDELYSIGSGMLIPFLYIHQKYNQNNSIVDTDICFPIYHCKPNVKPKEY